GSPPPPSRSPPDRFPYAQPHWPTTTSVTTNCGPARARLGGRPGGEGSTRPVLSEGAANAARPDGAQPPRGIARVPTGHATPPPRPPPPAPPPAPPSTHHASSPPP